MSQHKDLPSGSQKWADDVDKLMEENKHLQAVLRRLCENAGLDYSNPRRGLSDGTMPSATNPVGQKLSSLADVQIYNVADGQVPAWSQKDQKWLPVTLPSGGTGATLFEPRDGIDPTSADDAWALGHNEDFEGEPYAFYYFNNITAGLTASYNGVGVSSFGLGQSGGPSAFCSDGLGNYSYFGVRHDYFEVFSPLADFRGVDKFTLQRHTSRPTSPLAGTLIIEASTNKIIHYTGSGWCDALGTAV